MNVSSAAGPNDPHPTFATAAVMGDQSDVRRRLSVVAGWGAVAAGIAGTAAWLAWAAEPLPQLPQLDLQQAAAPVRAAVAEALAGVQTAPRDAASWGRLGMVLLAHQFDADSIECLQRAAQLAPQEFRWSYLLGLATTATDRQRAIAAFRRACELRPDDPTAHTRLGELLLGAGQLAEAEVHLRQAGQLAPAEPRSRLALARLELQRGNPAAAESHAAAAAQAAPESRSVYEVLLQALGRQGRQQQVAEIRQRLARLSAEPLGWNDPHAAEVLRLRVGSAELTDAALQLAEAGRQDAAIQLLEREVITAQRDPVTFLTLARLYRETGQIERALDVLATAQEKFPESAEVCFQIGVLQFLQDSWSAAADSFRATLALQPDYALASYNLGHCCLQLGQDDRALQAFQQACRLSPEAHAARINVARLLLKSGQHAAAEAELQLVLQLAPENSEARQLLESISDQR